MSNVRGQHLTNCQSNLNQHVKSDQNLAIKVSDQNVKIIQTMKPTCHKWSKFSNKGQCSCQSVKAIEASMSKKFKSLCQNVKWNRSTFNWLSKQFKSTCQENWSKKFTNGADKRKFW